MKFGTLTDPLTATVCLLSGLLLKLNVMMTVVLFPLVIEEP